MQKIDSDDGPSMTAITVGNVPFAATSLRGATDAVIALAQTRTAEPIRLANAYCIATAQDDDDYMKLLQGQGINFPDGSPVVWFMRRAAPEHIEPRQVRGPSLFENCLRDGRIHGLRHYFVGTTDTTLDLLTKEAMARYPGVKIAGTYSPKFAPVTAEMVSEIAEHVLRSDCDVVWVAMGTPKQDFVAAALAPLVQKPCVGVGAAFDFVAGTSREAPPWIRGSHFEWLFRFLSEPRRLWRRYTLGNVQFLRAATGRSAGLRRR